MDFAELIFAELRRRDISLREFAALTGVDHSTLSQIRNRKQVPSPRTIAKLSSFLGKSEDELLALAGHRSEKPAPPRPQPLMPYAVPVYDQAVSAGKGEPVIRQYLYLGPDEGIPSSWYGLPVVGTCMVPLLLPGDVVIINPDGKPESGDMVVADFEHEKALVKWFAKHKEEYWLEPEKGEPILYDEEKVRIVGVVMQIWRNPRGRPRREWRRLLEA